MCGIVGIWAAKLPLAQREERVRAMLSACIDRGPDGSRILSSGDLTVGFCRLAIVGEREGESQPLESSRAIGAINGEIYNHLALRTMLGQSSDARLSDSIVLLPLAEAQPEAFLARLDGIFAGFVFDRMQRTLTLFRDHIGVKPMYYNTQGEERVFGSTVAAVVAGMTNPTFSQRGILRYLLDGYPATTMPLIEGVKAVLPGSLVRFAHPESHPVERRWFSLARPGHSHKSIRELLLDAVESEIPTGWPTVSALSGGIDSTLITLLLHRAGAQPTALTVKYDTPESGAEADLAVARRVATDHRIGHHEVHVSREDYAEEIARGWRFDQPIADPNAIAFHRMAAVARQLGSRVLFTGDGADELFAGYTYHQQAAGALPRALAQSWLGTSMTSTQDRRFLRELTGSRVRHRIHPSFGEPLRAVQTRDLREWLEPNLLAKLDRFGMAAGVEARVPFLRPALVQAAFALSRRDRVDGSRTKVALRNQFADVLPSHVLDRAKVGFPSPLSDWLRGPLGRDLATLAKDSVAGMWDPSRERDLWQQHITGERDWGQQLWRVAVLRSWDYSLRR